MSRKINNKIYFPNLNGLRVIAAFLVLIHHIEQFKSILNIDNYWNVGFVGLVGQLGVILFFVLSGFLITYLLLAEEESFQKISIRKFYARRILRIWPLYLLIIGMAFFILPNISIFNLPGLGKEIVEENLLLKLFLYVIFMPNLVFSIFGVIPYASHTWSIGVEEQFYLVWPILLKYFKRYRIALMISIVILYLIISIILGSNLIPFRQVINSFWYFFNIDCMAIGGIFAIFLFQKDKILKILLNNFVFYSTLILVTILMAKGVYIPYIHFEFYSGLFGIIILNFAANPKIGITLENPILNYLGKISYGIYMFHSIGIILAINTAKYTRFESNILIYPMSFLITILFAGISHKYFESFFLQFKAKFSNILSGS